MIGTVPAIVTGLVAGFFGVPFPKLRFWLLVGLAAAASAGAFLLSYFFTTTCPELAPVDGPGCVTSPHDPLGAFAGAEYVVLFQAAVTALGRTVRKKYPPVRSPD